jgi:hypothetical protein
VKGIGAGRKSQVNEWVAGCLGIELKLPIAPFKQVHIPFELTSNNSDYNDLGHGLAFGSEKQQIVELNYAGVGNVPDPLQKELLAFDWWIKNEDRTLTEKGGNPNLFWAPYKEKLVIIDHNLAFDDDFLTDNFKSYHVFSDQVNSVFGNAVYQLECTKKFKRALKYWPKICKSIPKEWYYSDLDKTVSADFDLQTMLNLLEQCKTNNFWNTP